MAVRILKISRILCLLLTIAGCLCNQVFAAPGKKSGIDLLKRYTRHQNKSDIRRLYTDKWLSPGSFYGQVFLKEEGYLNLYEWLEVPKDQFVRVETSVDKQNEFLKTVRGYMDDKSKYLDITIIAPHPRSVEPLKLGLVPKYEALFPSAEEIEATEETNLPDNRKARCLTLKSGEYRVIYTSPQGTKIIGKIDHFRAKENLIGFFRAINLNFFEQRINS